MRVVHRTGCCILSVVLLMIAGVSAGQARAARGGEGPRVFLLDSQQLARVRAHAHVDASSRAIVTAATTDADRVLQDGPFSVMQKTVMPPSGNRHDYMSQAPYFWPDPNKPDGLPYIRRDGEHNPEIKRITDHDQFLRMGEDARTLALAFYLTGNMVYAERAALLLRTWFLNPATRMNPHLEFGQGIPGINTGRGIGIIESRALVPVVDAVGLLETAAVWTRDDEAGMRTWLTAYLHWMQTSAKGIAESEANNNHGSWYDLQVVCIELFLGHRAAADTMLERVKTRRIAVQIEPDGRQLLELARTNAWGYSNGNLDALVKLAVIGKREGVDLWNYRTADGRSIRKAIDFLLPYAGGMKKWDYAQIGGFHVEAAGATLERAAAAYHDVGLRALAHRLTAEHADTEMLLLADGALSMHD